MQAALEINNSTETDATRIATDTRADGGCRRVSMNARRVLIERRVSGISMRVGIPTKSYTGVVLSISDHPNGRIFRIALAHTDADLAVILCETGGQDGIAEWKQWARFFCLPRLIARDDGSQQQVDEMIGPVSIGAASPAQRRNGNIAKRRPRFLMRRHPGNASAAKCFFGDEREIICYE